MFKLAVVRFCLSGVVCVRCYFGYECAEDAGEIICTV